MNSTILDSAVDFVGFAALVFENLQFLASLTDFEAADFEFYWLNYCFCLLLFYQ